MLGSRVHVTYIEQQIVAVEQQNGNIFSPSEKMSVILLPNKIDAILMMGW